MGVIPLLQLGEDTPSSPLLIHDHRHPTAQGSSGTTPPPGRIAGSIVWNTPGRVEHRDAEALQLYWQRTPGHSTVGQLRWLRPPPGAPLGRGVSSSTCQATASSTPAGISRTHVALSDRLKSVSRPARPRLVRGLSPPHCGQTLGANRHRGEDVAPGFALIHNADMSGAWHLPSSTWWRR